MKAFVINNGLWLGLFFVGLGFITLAIQGFQTAFQIQNLKAHFDFNKESEVPQALSFHTRKRYQAILQELKQGASCVQVAKVTGASQQEVELLSKFVKRAVRA